MTPKRTVVVTGPARLDSDRDAARNGEFHLSGCQCRCRRRRKALEHRQKPRYGQ